MLSKERERERMSFLGVLWAMKQVPVAPANILFLTGFNHLLSWPNHHGKTSERCPLALTRVPHSGWLGHASSKHMVDVLLLVWGTALCTERVKPPKAHCPHQRETGTTVKSAAPRSWAGAVVPCDYRAQDEEESHVEALGCLLPPSLQSNMWVTPAQMKSHRRYPIGNIILTGTELRGRVLERCLFSDEKKVRGAFVDIFGYPVLLLMLNGMRTWEKYTRKWELQRFNLNYQGDAGMSW